MKSLRQLIFIATTIFLGFVIVESSEAGLITTDLRVPNTTVPVSDPLYNTFSYQYDTDDGVNFIVTTEDVGSSGTGLINSFLRVQQNGQERGFNSDRTTAYYDEGVSQTDSLQIDLVSTFNYEGTEYGEFLLDTNEPLVSLNQVQIFVAMEGYATDPNLVPSGEDLENGVPYVEFDQAVEVFRLSDMTNWYDILVPSSGSGSGTYDMRLFVEWDEVSALYDMGYTHLIFYSQFGSPPGQNGTQSGFEEWSTARDDIASVPEPSTWAMLLITACGAIFIQYRQQRKQKLTTDADEC